MAEINFNCVEVIKSLASILITFLVRISGQKSSSALMMLTCLVTVENSFVVFCKIIRSLVKFKLMDIL